jgi:hypothetical protein
MLKSSWNTSDTKDLTNGKEPTSTFKIWRPDSCVRTTKGSDIEWSNPYGDQTTHFVNCTESPNVPNFSYNCKKNVTHLRQDQLCAYHLPTKEKHK